MINYLKEVRGEMRHVTWPTRQATVLYTGVVIGVSLLTAAYLGLLDYVFTAGVQHLI